MDAETYHHCRSNLVLGYAHATYEQRSAWNPSPNFGAVNKLSGGAGGVNVASMAAAAAVQEERWRKGPVAVFMMAFNARVGGVASPPLRPWAHGSLEQDIEPPALARPVTMFRPVKLIWKQMMYVLRTY